MQSICHQFFLQMAHQWSDRFGVILYSILNNLGI